MDLKQMERYKCSWCASPWFTLDTALGKQTYMKDIWILFINLFKSPKRFQNSRNVSGERTAFPEAHPHESSDLPRPPAPAHAPRQRVPLSQHWGRHQCVRNRERGWDKSCFLILWIFLYSYLCMKQLPKRKTATTYLSVKCKTVGYQMCYIWISR